MYKVILKEIFDYAKNLRSDLIQFKYQDEEVYKILKQIIFLNKKYDFCSFYYYCSDQKLMLNGGITYL